MRTLRLGNIELIPIYRDFSSYKEFLDWSDSLSDGLRKSNYKESKYIISLKKLGLFDHIKDNYSVTLTSEIVLQVEDNFGFSMNGLSLLIEDPIEVEKFLNHEDAIGLNNNGDEVGVKRGDSDIIDWSEESSILFIVRTI